VYNEIHSIPYAIEIWYEQCLFQSIKYFKCVRGIQRGVCIYFLKKITLGVSVSAQRYVHTNIYKYKVFLFWSLYLRKFHGQIHISKLKHQPNSFVHALNRIKRFLFIFMDVFKFCCLCASFQLFLTLAGSLLS